VSPAQHIEWLVENTEWFASLDEKCLGVTVPACPGWTIENVVTHLAFGLGIGYRHALAVPPHCPDHLAFADVTWPTKMPIGAQALTVFQQELRACIERFRSVDPATTCYTYAGPGVAAFWFRRAAIETTLHRMDVTEALASDEIAVSPKRAEDAIAETIEFALPLAARWTGREPASIAIRPNGGKSFVLGVGPVVADIGGDRIALLGALWGRSRRNITVEGDYETANCWLTRIEVAFAGR
jgi:uncharacterized protein (TIGR03083 family)